MPVSAWGSASNGQFPKNASGNTVNPYKMGAAGGGYGGMGSYQGPSNMGQTSYAQRPSFGGQGALSGAPSAMSQAPQAAAYRQAQPTPYGGIAPSPQPYGGAGAVPPQQGMGGGAAPPSFLQNYMSRRQTPQQQMYGGLGGTGGGGGQFGNMDAPRESPTGQNVPRVAQGDGYAPQQSAAQPPAQMMSPQLNQHLMNPMQAQSPPPAAAAAPASPSPQQGGNNPFGGFGMPTPFQIGPQQQQQMIAQAQAPVNMAADRAMVDLNQQFGSQGMAPGGAGYQNMKNNMGMQAAIQNSNLESQIPFQVQQQNAQSAFPYYQLGAQQFNQNRQFDQNNQQMGLNFFSPLLQQMFAQ